MPAAPKPHLSFPLLLLVLKLQASLQLLQSGPADGILRALKLNDLVFGLGASTTSRFAEQYNLGGTFAPVASWPLLRRAVEIAEGEGFDPVVGNILSADVYYDDDPNALSRWARMGVLAVEMEAAGLYANAARLGKHALCICTISNSILTGEEMDPVKRENSFSKMVEVALKTAVSFE